MARRRVTFERTTSYSHLLPCDRPLSLQARWIWLGQEIDTFDSTVVALSEFALGKHTGPVRVWVGCTGDYQLWVDGQWVGRGPTPSSLGHLFLDEHAIEPDAQGTHRAVLLGRNDGFGTNSRPRRVGGMIAQVETLGGKVLAATDDTWQVGHPRAYREPGPRLYSSIGFAEHVDMGAFPDDLGTRPEALADLQPAAVVQTLDQEALLPREIPPLRQRWCPAEAVVYIDRIHVPRGITSVALAGRPAGDRPWRARASTAVYVTSPELPVSCQFRCDDAARVKISRQVVIEQGASAGYRWWMAPESLVPGPMHGGEGECVTAADVTLRRGWNPIDVDVQGCEKSWGFMMRWVDASGRTLDLPRSADRDVARPGWAVRITPTGRPSARSAHSHEVDTPHYHATALSDWQVGYDWQPGGPLATPLVIEPDHCATIDLGDERAGFTELTVDGPAGAVLDLRYSEAINDHGRLESGAMIAYADRLRLRDGQQRWRSLGRKGWRYVQVSLRSASRPVRIERIGMVETSAVGKPDGSFNSSDPMLNTIYLTSVHTLRMCMQEQWLDCPTREWGQYPGDARIEALQAYMMSRDTRLSRKGLRQFARIQAPDGFFRALAPAGTWHRLPDYCLVWVTWLAEHVLHTGDRVLADELYPVAEAALGWFEHLRNKHGLLVNPDDYDWWLFLDHSPMDKRGEVTGFNAFYVRACRDLAFLARTVGRSERATHWTDRASQVATAMRRRLWSRRHGLFADSRTDAGLSSCITQTGNVLAVWCGATSKAVGRSVLRRLIAPDGSSILPIEAAESGFFKNYVLGALYDVGLPEVAMALMHHYWGAMINTGLGTWRECFSIDGPTTPSSSTYCHAWSGAPGYFLPAYVLGVRPGQPGYDAVTVSPHLGNLDWADGVIPTPHGPVAIQWERARGGHRGSVELPVDLPCRLVRSRSVRAQLHVRVRPRRTIG